MTKEEQIAKQPVDKEKDKILLDNKCVFSQKQFLGPNGREPRGNEEVSGTVSNIYKAMDDYAGSLISRTTSVTTILEVPKHILDEYAQSLAKQKAIAFAQWTKKNCETSSRPDIWYLFEGKTISKELTTNQLYELYQEILNKQP